MAVGEEKLYYRRVTWNDSLKMCSSGVRMRETTRIVKYISQDQCLEARETCPAGECGSRSVHSNSQVCGQTPTTEVKTARDFSKN